MIRDETPNHDRAERSGSVVRPAIPGRSVKRPVHRGIKEQIRHALEQLSLAGPEGATPADLGITATLLERLITRRMAERLPPLVRGASYRYRISEKGTTSLITRE
jgi:hypothetical protein